MGTGIHAAPVAEPLERRTLLAGGEVDPYFGDGGRAHDAGGEFFVLRGGSIVTAATFSDPAESGSVTVVRKFTPDGRRDARFEIVIGRDGLSELTSDARADVDSSDPIVAVDVEDRILVGTAERLYRFTASGKLDSSFGRRGRVAHPLNDVLNDVVALRDGRIVLTGSQGRTREDPDDGTIRLNAAAVVRLTSSGARDVTFGPDGVRLLTSFQVSFGSGEPSFRQQAGDTWEDHAGRLLIALEDSVSFDNGETITSTFIRKLIRVNADGSEDDTLQLVSGATHFGTQTERDLVQVVPTPDGRMFVLTRKLDTTVEPSIMRLRADGSVDASFAGDGSLDAFPNVPEARVARIMALPDRSLLVLAWLVPPNTTTVGPREAFLMRFRPDGTPEALFGQGGTQSLGVLGVPRELAVARDGSILTSTFVADTPEFVLQRLWRDDRPAATVRARDVTSPSSVAAVLTVTYRDDESVDAATLDNRDLRVAGPNGFVASARFDRIVRRENGDGLIVARYKLPPPGGVWDAADDGTYTIQLRHSEVVDADANPAHPRLLGASTVDID